MNTNLTKTEQPERTRSVTRGANRESRNSRDVVRAVAVTSTRHVAESESQFAGACVDVSQVQTRGHQSVEVSTQHVPQETDRDGGPVE